MCQYECNKNKTDMNFVYTVIPEKDYKEIDKQGSLTIVHLDATTTDGLVKCAETIVKDYDADEINTAYNKWKEELENKKLVLAKNAKIKEISDYDVSDNVNSFTIQGVTLWLSRDDRNALMRRFEAEKANNITTTTLWYGTNKFELPIDNAITMLNSIEVYACTCYDVTASHKATVEELTDINEVIDYNYKSGYPEKINL